MTFELETWGGVSFQSHKSKMEITALSVTEKAEVFRNISALSSVESQMEELISYVDKMLPFLRMLNSSSYSGSGLNQCAKIKNRSISK